MEHNDMRSLRELVLASGSEAPRRWRAGCTRVSTSGAIPSGHGPKREVELLNSNDSWRCFNLPCATPDFTTRWPSIEATITRNFAGPVAAHDGAGTVPDRDVAANTTASAAHSHRADRDLVVQQKRAPRVVVDQRFGNDCDGEDVRLSRVAVSQGNFKHYPQSKRHPW